MNGVNTRVTVVILTHNRTFEVLRTVERMCQLSERPPIIVVDNASHDNIASLVRRRFPAVNVIRLHKNIGAAARNAGVHGAITPYVAFCDDDMFWSAGSLARATRMLDQHPGVAAITPRVLVGPEEREAPASQRMAASPLPADGLPGQAVLGFLPGACVFRRYAFLQAGGYEAKLFMGGEDALLALYLVSRGWSLVYSDELLVHHYPSALRDAERRRRLGMRNALWVAWLRRSAGSAFQITLRALLGAAHDPQLRAGVLEAFRGLSWALGHRRAVPARVEAQCAMVERHGSMRAAVRMRNPAGRPGARAASLGNRPTRSFVARE